MNVIETKINGAMIIEPAVFGDSRGFFLETYQAQRYLDQAGIEGPFVQDNHSRSTQGVLRGLHFQKTKPQGKLVRVVRGRFLMWPLTCAETPLPLAIGLAFGCQRVIIASCGCRRV